MPAEFARTELFGVPFDHASGEEVARAIGEAGRAGRKMWVSTANLDWLIEAQKNPAFRESLLASDLVTCDGAPVRILSRMRGTPIPHRVTGVELFRRLRNGEGGPLRVGFFGAEGDEAERASRALNDEAGPLTGAGGYNPGHGSVEALSAQEHIEAINAMKADFLVLSLGAVKAQAWVMANRSRLEVPVVAHLGAVVRHVSGDTEEAPGFLARAGLEWIYRAANEPPLRARYARNFAALPGLAGRALSERVRRA
jgi:N-acetylglucosaminyldiphosphoundecaprenol N-acetyl-beta-D-mannosaminyltransferase